MKNWDNIKPGTVVKSVWFEKLKWSNLHWHEFLNENIWKVPSKDLRAKTDQSTTNNS